MIDTRFRQAHKEAVWSILLTLLYCLCWAASAYLLSNKPGLLGLPIWFEVSCLFVPLLFMVLCPLMIKKVYRLVSLGSNHDET